MIVESFRFSDEKDDEYEISHRATLSACKPSFWREKRNTARRHFSTRFCKNVVESKQVKNMVVVLPFFDLQKGSVTSNKNN